MSTAESPTLVRMSAEEFLALPDDGVHRELIDGVVRVIVQEPWDDPDAPIIPIVNSTERPMTVRNRFHSRLLITFGHHLESWLEHQPEPRGEVVGGECGFRLGGPNDSAVGIDVAFVSAEMREAALQGERVYIGPPVLAVEILSPYDTYQDIVDMVDLYLRYRVVVWVVSPAHRTITVHRGGQIPETFNMSQDLVGDPYLPGFRVPVSRFFS